MSRVTAAIVRRQVRLPLRLAGEAELDARIFSFDGLGDGREHVALALGDRAGGPLPDPAPVPLVRLHSECLTGDVLGSERCDCGPQLREAVLRLRDAGGYLLYLRQEGRGIGLYNKIDAYALQDLGLDTYEANEALGFDVDERNYAVAAQMLLGLGVDRVELLTNNPDKAAQLRAAGVHIDRCLPTALHLSPANAPYLAAKACRGHQLLDPAERELGYASGSTSSRSPIRGPGR
jgi:GTP cyclohydrolase II